MKIDFNRKVLLRDRKRHTAHRVGSVCSAVLSWGDTPVPARGYPRPVLVRGVPQFWQSCLSWGGGGGG